MIFKPLASSCGTVVSLLVPLTPASVSTRSKDAKPVSTFSRRRRPSSTSVQLGDSARHASNSFCLACSMVWGGGVRTRARSEGFTMLVPGDKVSARLFNGIVAQHEGHMPLLQHLDIDGTSKGLDVGCKVPHGSNKLIERSSNAPAIHLDGYGHGKRVRGIRRWRWRQDRRRRQRQRQR